MRDLATIQRRIEHYRSVIPVEERTQAPEPFLPESHSAVVYKQVEHIKSIIVKYANLLAQSGELLPFDTSVFDKHESDINLLWHSFSKDFRRIGSCLQMGIGLIKKVNEAYKNGTELDLDDLLFRFLFIGKVTDYSLRKTKELPADEGAIALEVEEYRKQLKEVKT